MGRAGSLAARHGVRKGVGFGGRTGRAIAWRGPFARRGAAGTDTTSCGWIMTEIAISAAEFERRMTALCLGGVGPALPRRRRDRHILLKSVALLLGHGTAYTERTINSLIGSWLEAAGPAVRLDHVSLRRHLVDEGYVVRDPAGGTYQVCPSPASPEPFDPAVDGLDPLGAVRAARAARQERRQRR
jgi:hypothetical protein